MTRAVARTVTGSRSRTPVPTTLTPLRITPAPSTRPPVLVEDGPPTAADLAPSPYVQDALAVDLATACEDEEDFGFQPTRRADLPDPRTWSAHLAQALVEVMSGSRPAPQLLRHTTSEVYAVVARRHAAAARRGAPGGRVARVRRVVVCEPADGVVEASVVVVDGPRVRALAMRLAGQDGRWRVEALQVG